jgi:hypothetical protein
MTTRAPATPVSARTKATRHDPLVRRPARGVMGRYGETVSDLLTLITRRADRGRRVAFHLERESYVIRLALCGAP